jgi:uncharacterized membrane protein YfcA
MTLVSSLILLATGLFVGFFGGLLGVGGGIIMTPVQYAIFTGMGMSPDLAMKLALGTSLMVILPTSMSGAWKHHQKKAVVWRAVFIMGSVALFASLGGSTLAAHIPGATLKVIFGVVIMLSAIRMVTLRLPEEGEEIDVPVWQMVLWALPIGLLSGLLGVGGGILAVPILTMALGFRMQKAVATSTAMIILTSIGGVVGYILNGHGVSGLPAYSLGYISLPAALLLSVSSVGMAQFGASAAHRLPAKQLRLIFVVLIVYMGLRMIGVFEWLHWPL